MQDEKELLMTMLSYPLTDSFPVLELFSGLPRAITYLDGEKRNFIYIPGNREDRAVLVAHADTVWDEYYLKAGCLGDMYKNLDVDNDHRPVFKNGIIKQGGWLLWGLGADDRAGCAMLYLLRNSGHSLLITDGEEHGQIGAGYLMSQYTDIGDELNSHQYMLQLDRRGSKDYKTYQLGVTEEFRSYIEKETGFEDAGRNARTDIVSLCRRKCGVNLSIGYYREHTKDEYLVYDEWLNTLTIITEMLKKPQPGFLLKDVI